MNLSSGARLGPYEILALSAGGSGSPLQNRRIIPQPIGPC